MLAAGEDARFIARRLVVLASEDVGMADPLGLVVADAAARAVEFVGLPEARLNLAHAVVYLASAPKSNRVYAALAGAMAAVEQLPAGEVPVHLRDASYPGAARLGHGAGYAYPHDAPSGFIEQDYRPAEATPESSSSSAPSSAYYQPSRHGAEGLVRERLARLWPSRYAATGKDDEGEDPADSP
jgi:putative ATPase